MNIPSLEDNIKAELKYISDMEETLTNTYGFKHGWLQERIKESKEALDKHKQLIRDIKLNDLDIYEDD